MEETITSHGVVPPKRMQTTLFKKACGPFFYLSNLALGNTVGLGPMRLASVKWVLKLFACSLEFGRVVGVYGFWNFGAIELAKG